MMEATPNSLDILKITSKASGAQHPFRSTSCVRTAMSSGLACGLHVKANFASTIPSWFRACLSRASLAVTAAGDVHVLTPRLGPFNDPKYIAYIITIPSRSDRKAKVTGTSKRDSVFNYFSNENRGKLQVFPIAVNTSTIKPTLQTYYHNNAEFRANHGIYGSGILAVQSKILAPSIREKDDPILLAAMRQSKLPTKENKQITGAFTENGDRVLARLGRIINMEYRLWHKLSINNSRDAHREESGRTNNNDLARRPCIMAENYTTDESLHFTGQVIHIGCSYAWSKVYNSGEARHEEESLEADAGVAMIDIPVHGQSKAASKMYPCNMLFFMTSKYSYQNEASHKLLVLPG
ncbi:hypothetical protein C8R48DRAFT_760381 [Suillus tomentosus]|nr:hypothetical protein C8R48DRAFT_760381 [Suillus tomentosus]